MSAVEAAVTPVAGSADPAFARVREVFEENFRSRGEIGAAVCIYKNGAKVVDLWGGHRDGMRMKPWEPDTLVCTMSVAKGVVALAVLMLVERGALDLEAPVARYWPGFGRAGKQSITVRQLLGGLGGLIYADHARTGALVRWEEMIEALERQEPLWQPGSRGAYHSMTQGFLLGELVRRVDGRRIEQFIREEIARPLRVDFAMGLTDAELRRVADLVPNPDNVSLRAIGDPSTKIGRAWQSQPHVEGFFFNSTEYRRAVIPSANGHSNARSVARIFALLADGGELDGVRLLSRQLIDAARTPQWDGICGLTDRDFRYGLGFFLNKPPLAPFGPGAGTFGHPGAGGALGFADPQSRLAFAYSPSFMCSGAGVGDRCEALVKAAYAARE